MNVSDGVCAFNLLDDYCCSKERSDICFLCFRNRHVLTHQLRETRRKIKQKGGLAASGSPNTVAVLMLREPRQSKHESLRFQESRSELCSVIRGGVVRSCWSSQAYPHLPRASLGCEACHGRWDGGGIPSQHKQLWSKAVKKGWRG